MQSVGVTLTRVNIEPAMGCAARTGVRPAWVPASDGSPLHSTKLARLAKGCCLLNDQEF
jgi:hypothetical protein